MNRRKERRRIRLAVVAPLCAALAGFGLFYLVRTSVPLKEIVFIGNSHLKNEELRSLIKVRENDGLFGAAGSAIYGNLKRSPWIKEAVVRRELTGRMLIKVTEGVPAAILSLEGVPHLVDRDGGILEQLRDGTVLLLPVIKDIDPYNNKGTFIEAVKFIRIINDRRMAAYDGVMEITGQRPEDITLKIDNISIKVGAGDYTKKLERLEAIKEEIQKRNMTIDYIDLRFANKVIVKPAVGADAEPRAVAAAPEPPGSGKPAGTSKR